MKTQFTQIYLIHPQVSTYTRSSKSKHLQVNSDYTLVLLNKKEKDSTT